MQINNYIRAGYPGLCIKTTEEVRALTDLHSTASQMAYTFATWDTSGTFRTWVGAPLESPTETKDADGPAEALSLICGLPDKAIVALPDMDLLLSDDGKRTPNPQLIRLMKTTLENAELTQKTVVLVGPRATLPDELRPLFRIIPHALPTLAEIRDAALTLAQQNDFDCATVDEAAKAAAGLTLQEATNALSLSAVTEGKFVPDIIWQTKCEIIAAQSPLEIVNVRIPKSELGGQDALLTWIERRQRAFTPEAKAFNLPTPKGILLLGPPGTGKSYCAKTIATLMGCPLVKLDMGRVYGSLVGESEANIRRCIEVAEAIAPCVLWIDELEKAASGSASSGRTDGGTGSRVLATLLTWLNDKTSSVFVVATANDVTALPPELMRKGRFDEQWFVDLPNPDERKTILEIHIRKRGHPIPAQLHHAALATEGFVGAELEAVVVEALFNAFDESKSLELQHIVQAAHATKPMATMMKEQIDALRKWADGRARPASSAPAATSERVRKLDVGGKN